MQKERFLLKFQFQTLLHLFSPFPELLVVNQWSTENCLINTPPNKNADLFHHYKNQDLQSYLSQTSPLWNVSPKINHSI